MKKTDVPADDLEGVAVVGCSLERFVPTKPEEDAASYIDRVSAAVKAGGLAAEQADALARGGSS